MAAIVSLLSDHKTVYLVDDGGTRSSLMLSSTHGVDFSVDGNGDVTAAEATSAATGGLEASVDVTVMDWSLNYYKGSSPKILRLVGTDSVDMGLKTDQRTIDIENDDYNLKRVGNNIEIRKV